MDHKRYDEMTIGMFRFSVYMGIRANDIIGVRLYMGKFIKFSSGHKNKKKNPPLLPIKTI